MYVEVAIAENWDGKYIWEKCTLEFLRFCSIDKDLYMILVSWIREDWISRSGPTTDQFINSQE